jgi:hypothetical protein
MVSNSYFHRKPAPRSELKRFLDQQIMPLAIDSAACLDIGITKAGHKMRQNPMISICMGLGIGILISASVPGVTRRLATGLKASRGTMTGRARLGG